MSIKLEFRNRTPNLSGINLYRFEGVFDPQNPPAPYRTFAGNIQEFVDEGTVPGVLYQYVIGSLKNGLETFSRTLHLCELNNTGPGPQQLLTGDHKHGYFGKVATADMPSDTDMATRFSLSAAWTVISTKNPFWLKFIVEGKILFIPAGPMFTVAPVREIYNAGLMFGVKGTASDLRPASYRGEAAVDQWKTIIQGENEYLVRCPRANGLKTYNGIQEAVTEQHLFEYARLWECAFLVNGEASLYENQPPKLDCLEVGGIFARGAYNVPLACAISASAVAIKGNASNAEGLTSRSWPTTGGNLGFYPVLELL